MKKLLIASVSIIVVFILIHSTSAQCQLSLERIATGLSRPVAIAHPKDSSNRLFILEQHTGLIRILDLNTKMIIPESFLDVGPIAGGSEQGLLGLVFDPNFVDNGFFYVNLTVSDGTTQIRRYRVSAQSPNKADSNSGIVILSYDQPFRNHNSGWMDFGPDGYLYIASGDGGAGFDPGNRAQSLETLLGKILRIDVHSTDGQSGLYGIPPDNPFVGVPLAQPEIWSYGLRNPWRCSFDRETGDLYIADVGQGQIEEIDFQPADSNGGENYGWRVMEGTLCSDNSQTDGNPPCNHPSLVAPIHEYQHPLGFAIVGGYVYRGKAIGGLHGTYFFADYSTTHIWSFRYDGQNITDFRDRTTELDPSPFEVGLISSFGQDEDGELYILDMDDGEIYKIIPVGSSLQADIDKNCKVDFVDYSLLASVWLSDQCDSDDGCLGSDLDQNGRVDNSDLKILADSWLTEDG